MRRAVVGAVGVVLVGGCAYYNGLFNANRLANEARRAEREGRSSEARSLWSRAAVKAESVAARFPRSKYRDDALLLQGLALSRLGSCGQAVTPLRLAADSSPERGMRTRARLLMGQCWLALEQPDSALGVLGPVADSGSGDDRSRALLLRGRARLRIGADAAALGDLRASDAPEAAFPHAVVLARLGRASDAAALLDSAVDTPYDEPGWLAALDTLGARAPEEAARLVERLAGTGRLGPGQDARLRLADGERWLRAGDTARSVSRFEAVAETVPDSAEGQVARAHLAIRRAVAAETVEAIAPLLDSLQAATRAGGPSLRLAGPYLSVLTRAGTALSELGTPLQVFHVAEDARDSLRLPSLASALFAEVERRYPESVIAPKALLAQAALRPQQADSLIARLETRYPESVYTLALRGEAGDRYRAVEDSLRQLGRDIRRERRGPANAERRVRNERIRNER